MPVAQPADCERSPSYPDHGGTCPRARVTKGPGSKAAGLAMALKLLEAAQDRWRAVNGPTWSRWCGPAPASTKGVMVERPDDVGEVAE